MANQKPNYSIESYRIRDNTREIYNTLTRRVSTQIIDDKSFCLCQTDLFNCPDNNSSCRCFYHSCDNIPCWTNNCDDNPCNQYSTCPRVYPDQGSLKQNKHEMESRR